MPDEDIDYSDIPELEQEWFRTAKLVMPDEETKERITIRLSREVTEYFRSQGKGYQSRMNAVLKAYVDAQKARESPSDVEGA